MTPGLIPGLRDGVYALWHDHTGPHRVVLIGFVAVPMIPTNRQAELSSIRAIAVLLEAHAGWAPGTLFAIPLAELGIDFR